MKEGNIKSVANNIKKAAQYAEIFPKDEFTDLADDIRVFQSSFWNNKINHNDFYYVQVSDEHGGYLVFDDGIYYFDGDNKTTKVKNWKSHMKTIED